MLSTLLFKHLQGHHELKQKWFILKNDLHGHLPGKTSLNFIERGLFISSLQDCGYEKFERNPPNLKSHALSRMAKFHYQNIREILEICQNRQQPRTFHLPKLPEKVPGNLTSILLNSEIMEHLENVF